MSSGFVTEAELEEARRVRQEEWERVRKPDQPVGMAITWGVSRGAAVTDAFSNCIFTYSQRLLRCPTMAGRCLNASRSRRTRRTRTLRRRTN